MRRLTMFFWEREYRQQPRAEYRHPGHADQSSHGSWAKGKRGPAPGEGRVLSREDIMAARFGDLDARTQRRCVPEGGHGMVSPDGEFMVVDRTGSTTPVVVEAVYDQMESLAATYGARATAVDIMPGEDYDRMFKSANTGTNFGPSRSLAGTELRTGRVYVKVEGLTDEVVLDSGFFAKVAAGTPKGAYVLTHEYGHVLTGAKAGMGVGFDIPPVSTYGSYSVHENAAELFTAYHYGDRSYSAVQAAKEFGFGTETRSEYRHPGHANQKAHGSWAHGSLDVQELDDMSPESRAAYLAKCAEKGIDLEAVEGHIESTLRDNPDLIAAGSTWYPHANDVADELVARSGGTLTKEQAAAVIAEVSPQLRWDSTKGSLGNEDVARELVDMHVSGKFDGVNMDDPNAVFEVWQANRSKGSSALPIPIRDAVRIMQTGDIDGLVTGMKRRSFYNNIMEPGQTSSVTVDVHMGKALMATGFTTKTAVAKTVSWGIDQRKTTGLFVESIGYTAVATATRNVADRLGLPPDVVQASYWLYAQGVKWQ